MKTIVLKDWLASGKIIVHKNGTADLTIYCAGETIKSKHKNERAARQKWYRFVN